MREARDVGGVDREAGEGEAVRAIARTDGRVCIAHGEQVLASLSTDEALVLLRTLHEATCHALRYRAETERREAEESPMPKEVTRELLK